MFLNRIQRQLSTLGGGGAVLISDLDDVDTTTAKVDNKFLKYNASLGKWVGSDTAGGGFTLPTASASTLGGIKIGSGLSIDGSGVVTASGGSGSIAGISTTGTSVFNQINASGIVTASNFVGDGSGLTGIVGSGSGIVVKDSGSTVGTAGTINFGSNLSVSAISAGIVTVTGSAGAASTEHISTQSLTVAGVSTFNEDVQFKGANTNARWDHSTSDLILFDNTRLEFGSNKDFEIWHGGAHTYMKNSGGDLRIRGDKILLKRADDTETYLEANVNNEVKLFFNGSEKISTTNLGISVTGQGVFSSAITASTYIQGTSSNGGLKFFSDSSASKGVVLNTDDHLVPTNDSNSDLGLTGTRWRNVYADTLYGDGSNLTGITATADVVSDTSPQLGGDLDVQTREINTSTTNGNIKFTPNGSGVVEVKGAGGNDGTLQLNCSANSHGVKIKSPPHSAGASYTLTLPNTDGSNGQVLKTDGSGGLDWVNQNTGTLGSRQTNSATTGSIAQAASTSLTIPTAGKSFSLLSVTISAPAYVILYVDTTTRSADSSRSEGTDPAPGSGVITEVSTTASGSTTFLMTPAVLGWNNDGTPAAQIYAKVVNKRATSGSNAITVTLKTVALEA